MSDRKKIHLCQMLLNNASQRHRHSEFQLGSAEAWMPKTPAWMSHLVVRCFVSHVK